MKKKVISLMLAATFVSASLLGCGGSKEPPVVEIEEPDKPVVEEPEPEPEPETVIPEIEDEIEPHGALEPDEDDIHPIDGYSEYNYIGSNKLGYIAIYDDWSVKKLDSKDRPEIAEMQQAYDTSLEAPTDIITMISYDKEGWASKYDTELDVEGLASAMYNAMEADGCEEINIAQVTIGGYKAVQLFTTYAEDGVTIVYYIFETDKDDYIHYVTTEFVDDVTLAMIAEMTYSYDKPSIDNFNNKTAEEYIDKHTSGGNTTSSGSGDISDPVEATLENPAQLGEWVQVTRYNSASGDYEPIYVRITKVITDEKEVQKIIDAYNDTDPWSPITPWDEEDGDIGFIAFDYEAYYPEDFPMGDYKEIYSYDVDFDATSSDGSGSLGGYWLIGGNTDVQQKPDHFMPGDTLYGTYVVSMPRGFEDYLFSYDAVLSSETYESETHYFNPR